MTNSNRKKSVFKVLLGFHLTTMAVCSLFLLCSSFSSMATTSFKSGSDGDDYYNNSWRIYEEYGIIVGLFPFMTLTVGGLYHYFVIMKQDAGSILRHKWSCFVKVTILVLPWVVGVLTVALLIQVKLPTQEKSTMEKHHHGLAIAKRCMIESMVAQIDFLVVNLLSFITLGVYKVLQKYVLKPVLKNLGDPRVGWTNQGDGEGFVRLEEESAGFEDLDLTA